MDDKQFRSKLTELMQNNAPLSEVKTHFETNKPDNFDINYRDPDESARYETPLMDCLQYGVDLDVFKYLEGQGAKIEQSVSGLDYHIDGQRVPFNLNEEGKLLFYDQTYLDSYIKNQSDPRIKTRLENSHAILDHINENTTDKQKNDLCLLHLSTYFMDKPLFEKLLDNPNIDVNAKGGRNSEVIKMAVFDTRIRDDFFQAALSNDRVIVTQGTINQIVQGESADALIQALHKIDKTQIDEVILKVLELPIVEQDHAKKLRVLTEFSPKAVTSFLNDEQYQHFHPLTEQISSNGKNGLEILEEALQPYNQNKLAKEFGDKTIKAFEVLTPIVEEFHRNCVSSSKIDEKQAEQFYDKILNTLKKEQNITDDEIKKIKENPEFNKNIKKTCSLLNTNTTDLGIMDTIKYTVANFCKQIGHPNISTYIMNTIPRTNLEKISKLNEIISDSLTIGHSIPTNLKTQNQKNNPPLPQQSKNRENSR
jgi:hypothetical protein